jgi:hypothetical protein
MMYFGSRDMKNKKRFNVVKHLKSLSRNLLKTPQGRPIQSKKPKVLLEISRKEMKDSEGEA